MEKDKTLTYSVELITPEMATRYLKQNTNNRNVRPSHVQKFVNDLRTGHWKHDESNCISFDVDGVLTNGQHRLMAIVAAGIPGLATVVRNTRKDSFDVIDSGIRRSAGDVFDIAHIMDAHNTAAIINKYQSLVHNHSGALSGERGGTKKLLSRTEMLEEYYAHTAVYIDIVRFANSFSRRKTKLLNGSDIGAICAYLILNKRRDINTVKSFFTKLYECGDELPTLVLLRRKLVDDKTAPKATKMSSMMRRNMIATAWNAYVGGRNLKIINFPHNQLVEFK